MGGMKLISWNVNGLRAVHRKERFLPLVSQYEPDILCLQEIKTLATQLPDEARELEGYHAIFNSAEKKGYSGVALYTRSKPLTLELEIGDEIFDREGRLILAEYETFSLINVYLPSGASKEERQAFKLDILPTFQAFCVKIREERGKPLVICGDINVAHTELDLARPKQNQKSPGFTPEERAWMDGFLDAGFVDTYRHLHPDKEGAYSWWSYRGGLRGRNVGWRLDYWFVSENLRDSITNAVILSDWMGSDHCPVLLEIEENDQ